MNTTYSLAGASLLSVSKSLSLQLKGTALKENNKDCFWTQRNLFSTVMHRHCLLLCSSLTRQTEIQSCSINYSKNVLSFQTNLHRFVFQTEVQSWRASRERRSKNSGWRRDSKHRPKTTTLHRTAASRRPRRQWMTTTSFLRWRRRRPAARLCQNRKKILTTFQASFVNWGIQVSIVIFFVSNSVTHLRLLYLQYKIPYKSCPNV